MNIGLSNFRILKKYGFNLTYRWQDAFSWESDFGVAEIESFGTIDAQVNMKLAQWSSVVKVGGSNILNQYYVSGFGNSSIRALYYISVAFDEFLN